MAAIITPAHLSSLAADASITTERTLTPEMARAAAEDAAARVYGRLRVAILNAIPHEHAAILAIFGEPNSIPSRENADCTIYYVRVPREGMDDSFVALAGITGQGIAQAAAAAAQLKYKCRHLDKIILVGIAAAQPDLDDKEKDVRLGDIVIGDKIIQYDHIKLSDGKRELRGDGLPPADRELFSCVNNLRAYQDLRGPDAPQVPWQKYIELGTAGVRHAKRPDKTADPNHYQRKYTKGLDQERSDDQPFVHVGIIGSASTLLKDEKFRNCLNKDFKTIAYEMEGAGLAIAAAASGVGYLMVRGICDYGDHRKDDKWQTYASVCAAAFVRAIIEAR